MPAETETPTTLSVIARVHNDFPTKFGLARQGGLNAALESEIVFEPAYRNPDALRGLEGYSHLWLIWGFTMHGKAGWSPVVRPPRLGGNTRVGVFATRSPNRPNPLGLSCVQLLRMNRDMENGVTLCVGGADMMDGTPVYDIKPYIPYADSVPAARGGFADAISARALSVAFPQPLLDAVPAAKRAPLLNALAGDPRPAYQDDPARVYGFLYAGFNVRFVVAEGTLTVVEVHLCK